MSQSIDWSDVIKKEARGTGDADLGEVQEVGQHYVMTQKGIINKEKFYIPKYMVEGYDGNTLWFNVTEDQFREFMREAPPKYDEYVKYKTSGMATDIETRIPVIEERLEVSKKVSTTEATLVKEPVTETKTVEVPVMHEELRTERRQVTETREADKPVQTRTEVKVPLAHEEVEVTKKPYVKEEVVVTKEPVTETQTVSDTVTSERVETESGSAKIKKGARAA
jgi:uncharacterized protein (TIGR02271 family)